MTLYRLDAPSSTRISSGQTCRTSYFDSMHDNVSSASPSGHNDGKSRHPGSATGNLYCNNVLPGTATGNIFFSYQRPIVPLRNRNMEIQQHGNVPSGSGTWKYQQHGNMPSGSGTGIGLSARIGRVVIIWFSSGLEVTWGFLFRGAFCIISGI